MAKPGFDSGIACGRPAKGMNGPMGKGRADGTKHYTPKMPKVNGGSAGGGTKSK